MSHELPHDTKQATETLNLRIKLAALHRELSSYYRTKSRDFRTMSNLWYHIDGIELDLRSRGVEL